MMFSTFEKLINVRCSKCSTSITYDSLYPCYFLRACHNTEITKIRGPLSRQTSAVLCKTVMMIIVMDCWYLFIYSFLCVIVHFVLVRFVNFVRKLDKSSE